MTVAELAYEQIKTLPDAQAREVLDFIGYLKQRRFGHTRFCVVGRHR
jgi:hypothetical protein